MILTRSLMAILLVTALGLSACAGISNDIYPMPRPQDIPVGLDEGLITRDWDGGYPLRWIAFLLNPIGIVGDLLINQPIYLLAYQEPELFGYTPQDELYRRRFGKVRYSWETFVYHIEGPEQQKDAGKTQ
ncbi:MAG TPA: hypothetical protein VGQ07_02400 [Nitrospirales bacterium]|jgi:hypothetical protein|nr:hypothetical protein [Nitrospirales bacterium]